MHVFNGRFGPHHCVIYAINAFFGPDIGSFSEWLTSTLGLGRVLGSSVETWIHDPFYYALILGFPLSLLYSWVSRIILQKGLLDSFSGAGEPKFLFEGKTIKRMEILVLNYLKWHTKPHTPLNFVEYFLRRMNDDIETPQGPLITRSIQIILSTIKGIDFLEFKPSELAAAVAVFVSSEKRAMDIDKALSSFLIIEKIFMDVEEVAVDNPAYNSEFGVYEKGCGLNNVFMSWGHDDYMYLVAKENKSTLPSAGLFVIRYHSFYALHRSGAYKHLMNEEDEENLKWLQIFNKYDLYSKSKVRVDVEKVKPYYLSLIQKYFPAKLRW
ncbi:hypothetical protein CASFOL_038331 [Castilleja foliolosa]|uniref:Inositol oxygenase n=1 Tax=Castilleja foliolosa TaxID=1961234 RepID=A0ABD3BMR5_9LAMI